VDSLRSVLIIIVVLHHVAVSYGAGGPFYYVELHPDGFSRGLLIFVLANQAWFMGAFFLVAGYFTPGSFDRKGAGAFLGSRLVRLGIPLAFFALVLNPISVMGWFFVEDFLGPLTWETYSYTDSIRMGPMWFVALLLIFSFLYAGWRAVTRMRDVAAAEPSLPSYIAIAAFVAVLAATSFFLRMQISVGEELLGFPSLAYLPQYLAMFIVGTVAFRGDWFRRLPPSKGVAGAVAVGAAAVLLYPLAFSGEMFSLQLTEALSKAFGEGHWQSAVYALWDSATVVGLSLALIVLLRAAGNWKGAIARFLASHSYAVYVFHIPVVVFLAVLLRDVEMDHLWKFAMASAIAVPLCFLAAGLVRAIPGVKRVL
jgi:peptidoglycan/LPS O-acetylase OafA/YrhL